MVGIVIVTHSEKLALGIVDETRIMADDCPVAAAGGTDDGGYGTSCGKIKHAIEAVRTPDGVLVLADMGSAVMTAEMVIEDLGYPDVLIADCPVVEGAVAATLSSLCGDPLSTVMEQAVSAKNEEKM